MRGRGARDALWGGLLALGTVIAWLPALGGGFVYDDHRFILANEHLKQIDPLTFLTRADAVSSLYDQQTDIYRPLRTLSYAIDRAWFGLQPSLYHLGNVLLHAFNVAAGFWLLRALRIRRGLAVAVAALFALHPVQTEAVAWISGRADPMATAGVLITLLLVGRARRSSTAWLPLAGAAAAGALLSKENALILLPLVLLLELFWPPASRPRRLLVITLGLALLSAGYWWLRLSVLEPEMISQRGWFGGAWITHLGYAINGLGRYVQLLVWPVPLATSYPAEAFAPTSTGRVLLSLLWLAAPLGLAALVGRRAPQAWLAAAWFYIALAPVSQIAVVLQSVINERSLYLPAFGGLLLVALGVRTLLAVRAAPLWLGSSLTVVVAGLACGVTWDRIGDWRNDRQLWQAEVAVHPGNPAALFGLAAALAAEGEHEAALDRYEQILEMTERTRPPQYYFALYELAHADLLDERFDRARERYLEIHRAWNELGGPDPPAEAEVRARLARLTERWLGAQASTSLEAADAARLLTELEPERVEHWEEAVRRAVATGRVQEARETLVEARRRGITSERLERWSQEVQ